MIIRFRQLGLRGVMSSSWAPLVLSVAAILMCSFVIAGHNGALSPIDEWVYYDYLIKVPTEGFVRQGERISQEALNLMSCRGVLPYGTMGSPCGGDYSNYSIYPQEGKTSADAYTPAYFFITWAFASAINFFTGLEFLTAARLSGMLWLVGGVLVFYGITRELNVPKLPSVAAGLILIVSNFSRWTYTYISTDAPSFLVGAVSILFAILFVRGKVSGWWLVPISVFGVLLKVTNILAVGAVFIFLLLFVLFSRVKNSSNLTESSSAPLPRKIILVAVVSVLASFVAEILWLSIRAASAVGPPPYQEVLVSSRGLVPKEIATQAFLFISDTILHNVSLVEEVGYGYAIPWSFFKPFSWFCVAGVLACAFALLQPRLQKILSATTLVAGVTFAPILVFAMTSIGGVYFEIPARYGAALLPLFLLAGAIILRGRVPTLLVFGYSLVMFLLVVASSPFYG